MTNAELDAAMEELDAADAAIDGRCNSHAPEYEALDHLRRVIRMMLASLCKQKRRAR